MKRVGIVRDELFFHRKFVNQINMKKLSVAEKFSARSMPQFESTRVSKRRWLDDYRIRKAVWQFGHVLDSSSSSLLPENLDYCFYEILPGKKSKSKIAICIVYLLGPKFLIIITEFLIYSCRIIEIDWWKTKLWKYSMRNLRIRDFAVVFFFLLVSHSPHPIEFLSFDATALLRRFDGFHGHSSTGAR